LAAVDSRDQADGYRAQVHLGDGKATVYSCRGYDWTETFASIAKAAEALAVRHAVLCTADCSKRWKAATPMRKPTRYANGSIRRSRQISAGQAAPEAEGDLRRPANRSELEYCSITEDGVLREVQGSA
jgi:hypothetical protein